MKKINKEAYLLIRKKRGASGAEYALLLGLIGVLAIAVVANMGLSVEKLFDVTANKMEGAAVNAPASGGSGGSGGGTPPPEGSTTVVPNIFDFVDLPLAAPSTAYNSEIVQITGLSETAIISIASGAGTPFYRVCAAADCLGAGAFTTAAGSIDDNEYVQLRLTSGTACDVHTANITVGATTVDWVITDLGCVGIVGQLQGEMVINNPAHIEVRSADNLAFIASQGKISSSIPGGLTIVDVSDVTDPQLHAQLWDIAEVDSARSVELDGSTLYLTGQTSNRFTSIDITNPASPTVISSIVDGFSLKDAWDVSVVGTRAYVTARTGHRMSIIDITNPASMSVLGNVTDSGVMGWPTGIEVIGTTAFVSSSQDSNIVSVNVSNPAAPTVISSVATLAAPGRFEISGNFLYLASTQSTNTMEIVNISNPASMTHVSTAPRPVAQTYNSQTTAIALDIVNNRAYGSMWFADGVVAIDITNTVAPFGITQIVSETVMEFAMDLTISGNYVYVVSRNVDALTIIDITAM